MKNNLLENYLNNIDRTLSILPAGRRESERQELRSHLEEMIDNRILQGESEEEAAAYTLRQFGTAKSVGTGLRTAYLRSAWQSTPLGAILLALFLQFSATKLSGWYAQLFMPRGIVSEPGGWYSYLLLSAFCGGAIGAITTFYTPVRRALAATTLMQVLSVALMCSGIMATGALFLKIGPMGSLDFHYPDTGKTLSVFPVQQIIELVCGWVAAMCVYWQRRRMGIAR